MSYHSSESTLSFPISQTHWMAGCPTALQSCEMLSLETGRSGSEYEFCPLLALWSGVSYLTPLMSCFLLCEVGIIIPPGGLAVQIKWGSTCWTSEHSLSQSPYMTGSLLSSLQLLLPGTADVSRETTKNSPRNNQNVKAISSLTRYKLTRIVQPSEALSGSWHRMATGTKAIQWEDEGTQRNVDQTSFLSWFPFRLNTLAALWAIQLSSSSLKILHILRSVLVGSWDLHDLQGAHKHKGCQPPTMRALDFTHFLWLFFGVFRSLCWDVNEESE